LTYPSRLKEPSTRRMFEDLKKNIEQEKKIIEDLRAIQIGMQGDPSNKQFYLSSMDALLQQLALLNRAVPKLLKEGSPIEKLAEKKKLPVPVNTGREKSVEKSPSDGGEPDVVRMSYVSPVTREKRYITINKSDKKLYLEKLKLSEGNLLNLKKKKKGASAKETALRPSPYARISNRLFLRYSEKIAPRFSDLSEDLKKANIRFLLPSYLSMAIMSSLIAFVVGVLIVGLMIIISPSNWIYFPLPIGLVGLSMALFYMYPASEVKSVQKKISQELPFAVIRMAAIAGSNIEPTKIFKIIANSREYPSVGTEIRKVIAQTDIYGYDLVTALKNVARRTSNKNLSELFSGLATNISTGGKLRNYLEKKSENLLLDYKLERQKYAQLAGTFMDVYISILIAAPLVLMMMFIVMNVVGLGIGGLSIRMLLGLSIGGIVIVNIVFLIVLNMKQPGV